MEFEDEMYISARGGGGYCNTSFQGFQNYQFEDLSILVIVLVSLWDG